MSGNTARFIDEKSSLLDNAPLVVGLIVLLTVVLLFLLTGSVLLPLKTLLMNALTLAACLGILVLDLRASASWSTCSTTRARTPSRSPAWCSCSR